LSGACIEETAYKQNFLLRTGLCSGWVLFLLKATIIWDKIS
jgi:hypothetical protein